MSDLITKSVYVAIIGLANSGKSTLFNRFTEDKLSIVTPKKHTTRTSLRGIVTDGDTQIIFVDTPGIFLARRVMDKEMVSSALDSMYQADINILLVDAKKPVGDGLTHIIKNVIDKKNAILVLNKSDIASQKSLLEKARRLSDLCDFKKVFMISALNGEGVDDVAQFVKSAAPAREWMFSADQSSDAPIAFLAAEMTREKLFHKLRGELPYNVHVYPEYWQESEKSIIIHQVIYVVNESHKTIIVGKRGQGIKEVGMEARANITLLTEKKVHLYLFVKVFEKWQEKASKLLHYC